MKFTIKVEYFGEICQLLNQHKKFEAIKFVRQRSLASGFGIDLATSQKVIHAILDGHYTPYAKSYSPLGTADEYDVTVPGEKPSWDISLLARHRVLDASTIDGILNISLENLNGGGEYGAPYVLVTLDSAIIRIVRREDEFSVIISSPGEDREVESITLASEEMWQWEVFQSGKEK